MSARSPPSANVSGGRRKPAAVTGTDAATPSGYETYGAFVKDELEAQDKRKASFEQRGLAVITTSGALASLLFALTALSTKQSDTFVLPHTAQNWISTALGLFFASAIAALVTNVPLGYAAVKADEIRARLKEEPARSAERAAKDVALTRVRALASAKKTNGIKGWALLFALALEVLAVGCVAAAMSIVL